MGMFDKIFSGMSNTLNSPGALSGLAYLQARRMGMDPLKAMALKQQMDDENARTALYTRQQRLEEEEYARKRAAEDDAARRQKATDSVVNAYADPRYKAVVESNPQVFKSYLGSLGGLEQAQQAGMFPTQKAPTKVAERVGPDNKKYILWRDDTGQTWEEEVGDVRPQVPGASVTVDLSAKPYAEQSAKNLADWEAELDKGSSKAQTRLDLLQQLEPLMEQARTGRLAPALASVGAVLEYLKVPPGAVGIDPQLPATAEAINAIAAELTLAKIGGEGGMPANNFSDADRAFIQSTAPRLQNTPEGNRIIMQTARAVSNRQLDKHLAWLDYKSKAEEAGKVPSKSGFEFLWITRMRNTPLFPVVSTPEEAARLPKGTIFTAPDGTVKVR